MIRKTYGICERHGISSGSGCCEEEDAEKRTAPWTILVRRQRSASYITDGIRQAAAAIAAI